MSANPITAKEIITRGFKAVMSNGDDIRIDPSELDLVQRALAAGTFIRVRQGIINPSFVVSVIEDRQRRIEFLEDTKYSETKRSLGMRSLADIFSKDPPRLTAGPPAEEKGRTLPEQTRKP